MELMHGIGSIGWRHVLQSEWPFIIIIIGSMGHPRHMGRPHLTWMDTAMHGIGSIGHTLQIDLPRDWTNLALYWDVWRAGGGQPVLSCEEQCLTFRLFFPFLLSLL